jgi:hypothetical protein
MLQKFKKLCPGCGELKIAEEEFSTDPNTKDGYDTECKECRSFAANRRLRISKGLPVLADTRKQRGHKKIEFKPPKKAKDIVAEAPILREDHVANSYDSMVATVLAAIENLSSMKLGSEAVDFIRDQWWQPGCFILIDDDSGPISGSCGVEVTLRTAGWPGNELVMEHLQKSSFWARYWKSSSRDGVYVLNVPKSNW